MVSEKAPGRTRGSRPLKASDVLANSLRARILEEGLPAGTPLPSETDLIQDYEYSRGTVREALRLLESEGFIQIQRGPKGGITVRYPDFSLVSRSMATLLVIADTPLSELFEFRKVVEPAAARDVALHATDEQRVALRELMESPRAAHSGASFHQLLGECVKNDILRVTLASLTRILEWHMGVANVAETDMEQAGRAHERIVKAILAKDGNAAAKAMLTHIDAFEKVMGESGSLNLPVLARHSWSAQLRQGVGQA